MLIDISEFAHSTPGNILSVRLRMSKGQMAFDVDLNKSELSELFDSVRKMLEEWEQDDLRISAKN